VLGTSFSHYRLRQLSSGQWRLVLAGIALFASLAVLSAGFWSVDSPGAQLMFSAAGIGAVVMLVQSSGSRLKVCAAWLGRYSMEIYCCHVMTASGMRIILQHFLAIDSAMAHLFLGLIAGLFLPILFIRMLLKTSVGHYLFTAPALR